MVEIALLFVGAAVLVLLLMLAAAIVYVPKALSTGHGEDEEDHGSGGRTA
jgi:hypothetical protein